MLLLSLVDDRNGILMKSTINDGSVPKESIAMVTMKMKNQALSHLCASFAWMIMPATRHL